MPIIEYRLNDENQSQVVKHILEDWNLNTFNIMQSDIIDILRLIEDKSQVVCANIDDSDERNVNMYTANQFII